jgi:16S rRNA (uracil1498-N3)-methyltransferase
MKRALLEGATLGVNEVSGPLFHHLKHVLRTEVAEEIEVFTPQGLAFRARVVSLHEAHLVLDVFAMLERRLMRHVTLVQGLPKGDKLELILQKGTELGASGFVVVEAERSIAKIKDGPKKLARWRRIVEEAARQSGRHDVPALDVSTWEQVLKVQSRCIILDEEERVARLSSVVQSISMEQPLHLVVGPEGGLSRAEVQLLQRGGAITATLGSLVLRTETAGFAALAVVRHLDGTLG